MEKYKMEKYKTEKYKMEKYKTEKYKTEKYKTEKYKGRTHFKNPEDMLIKNLKIFHFKIKEYYIIKYESNQNIIIDVGSGRLSDLSSWEKAVIENVIAIEPSLNSFRIASDTIEKRNNWTNIYLLYGVGDKNWKDGSASLMEDKKHWTDIFNENLRADAINFMFSLHYMIENGYKDIIKNIKDFINDNGFVIILCMNGELINAILSKNKDVFEVKKEGKVLLRINRKGERLINVTLASTYGLEQGIDEHLINFGELIKEFQESNIILVEHRPFDKIGLRERNYLSSEELQITSLYTALIFQRQDNFFQKNENG